jgi:hypothetical protein
LKLLLASEMANLSSFAFCILFPESRLNSKNKVLGLKQTVKSRNTNMDYMHSQNVDPFRWPGLSGKHSDSDRAGDRCIEQKGFMGL